MDAIFFSAFNPNSDSSTPCMHRQTRNRTNEERPLTRSRFHPRKLSGKQRSPKKCSTAATERREKDDAGARVPFSIRSARSRLRRHARRAAPLGPLDAWGCPALHGGGGRPRRPCRRKRGAVARLDAMMMRPRLRPLPPLTRSLLFLIDKPRTTHHTGNTPRFHRGEPWIDRGGPAAKGRSRSKRRTRLVVGQEERWGGARGWAGAAGGEANVRPRRRHRGKGERAACGGGVREGPICRNRSRPDPRAFAALASATVGPSLGGAVGRLGAFRGCDLG